MQPNTRNIIFAFFSIFTFGVFATGLGKTIEAILDFERAGASLWKTYMTASLAWFYVSILAPIFSLRRLHRRRIAEKKPLKRHLFVLRWPWRKDFNKSFSRVLDLIHNALELG